MTCGRFLPRLTRRLRRRAAEDEVVGAERCSGGLRDARPSCALLAHHQAIESAFDHRPSDHERLERMRREWDHGIAHSRAARRDVIGIRPSLLVARAAHKSDCLLYTSDAALLI